MTHLDYRLYGRLLPDHIPTARRMVSLAVAYHCAALVRSVDRVKCNDGSNGDTLIVIARNGRAVTAMYARSGQVNAEHLRVSEIIRL